MQHKRIVQVLLLIVALVAGATNVGAQSGGRGGGVVIVFDIVD